MNPTATASSIGSPSRTLEGVEPWLTPPANKLTFTIYYTTAGTLGVHLPAHILAGPGDIAEIAITSGDPERVEQLSRLLKDAKLVNSNRGFTTYTGYYGKTRLTVAAHGIGGPSASIVFEELHMLGAKTIIRFGTAGALVKGLGTGDFVIATGAAYPRGSLQAYVDDGFLPAVPDIDLTYRLIQACKKAKLRSREGLVFSSDSFYTQATRIPRALGPQGRHRGGDGVRYALHSRPDERLQDGRPTHAQQQPRDKIAGHAHAR